MAEQQNESSVLKVLRFFQSPDSPFTKDPNNLQLLQIWTLRARVALEKIYGKDAPELAEFSLIPKDLPAASVRETFIYKLEQLWGV